MGSLMKLFKEPPAGGYAKVSTHNSFLSLSGAEPLEAALLSLSSTGLNRMRSSLGKRLSRAGLRAG